MGLFERTVLGCVGGLALEFWRLYRIVWVRRRVRSGLFIGLNLDGCDQSITLLVDLCSFWCLIVMGKDVNEKRADSSLFLFRIRLARIFPSVLRYLLFRFPKLS